MMSVKIKDINGNILKKKEGRDKLLSFLYDSISGKLALKGLTSPRISEVAGKFCDSPLSQGLIVNFIKSAEIDLTEYEPSSYRSFNEFFTRKIRPEKRPPDMTPEAFISPCDGKLSVYGIETDNSFMIKNCEYTAVSLLKNARIAQRFSGGLCLVFRLDVDDYHRYIYIDDGTKSENVHIKGRYHTVNPAALENDHVFTENTREATILNTKNFGDIAQVEVGAMLVGRIKNLHGKHSFQRGEEKGMFEYGGSTIVMLTTPNAVRLDEVFLENTREGFETAVKMGQRIGTGSRLNKMIKTGD